MIRCAVFETGSGSACSAAGERNAEFYSALTGSRNVEVCKEFLLSFRDAYPTATELIPGGRYIDTVEGIPVKIIPAAGSISPSDIVTVSGIQREADLAVGHVVELEFKLSIESIISGVHLGLGPCRNIEDHIVNAVLFCYLGNGTGDAVPARGNALLYAELAVHLSENSEEYLIRGIVQKPYSAKLTPQFFSEFFVQTLYRLTPGAKCVEVVIFCIGTEQSERNNRTVFSMIIRSDHIAVKIGSIHS